MKNDNRRDGGNRGYRNTGDRFREGRFDREGNTPRREGRFDRGGDAPRRDGRFGRGNDTPRHEGRFDREGSAPRRDRHYEGPGRRTYSGGNPPRVGRVTEGVPKARRVDGGDSPRRDDVPRRDFSQKPHHGPAYRSESGPRPRPVETPPVNDSLQPPDPALTAEFAGGAEDEHILAGRNPIREALRANRPIEKLLVADGDLSGAGREIVKLAKDAGVIVRTVERSWLDQLYPNHQGMLAYVAAVPYTPVEDMLAAARDKGEDPCLVVLDGIVDPHNLGAIIRSAECAGAHGVVIPERRSAGLSPTAAKAAAGALNHMPVARVGNLNRTLEELKAAGLWVTGAAMSGESAYGCDLTGPIALVIGSEGDGISRLTLEKCDRVVSLPVRGHIDSLNASVAAGVLMYEIIRQRGL